FAVLYAGRAGRLAGPAVEAQVEVAADVGVQVELAVGDGAHQVNAAARAVGLVAQLDVGGTGGGAEAAVDAGEEQRVVDAVAALRPGWQEGKGSWGRGRGGNKGGGSRVSDRIHKAAGVEQAARVEPLLHLAHQPPVAAGSAPDRQGLLPR